MTKMKETDMVSYVHIYYVTSIYLNCFNGKHF